MICCEKSWRFRLKDAICRIPFCLTSSTWYCREKHTSVSYFRHIIDIGMCDLNFPSSGEWNITVAFPISEKPNTHKIQSHENSLSIPFCIHDRYPQKWPGFRCSVVYSVSYDQRPLEYLVEDQCQPSFWENSRKVPEFAGCNQVFLDYTELLYKVAQRASFRRVWLRRNEFLKNGRSND